MQQQKYIMTPEEQQEYIGKLQSGKAEIEDKASLEYEACVNMREKQTQIRQLTNDKNQMEKQAEQITARIKSLDADINAVAGELTGYAQMLVWAEDKRRRMDPSQPLPTAQTPAEAKAIALAREGAAKENKKPGPKPGVQPKHLKALKGGGNGKAIATPEPVKPEAPGADEPEGDEDSDTAN